MSNLRVITLSVDLAQLSENSSVNSATLQEQTVVSAAILAGPAGPTGARGPTGAAGVGMPPGGTTGQFVRKKTGADFDFEYGDFPAALVTNTFVVDDEAGMLALVADQGDVAVRTDLNSNFILRGTDPTDIGDWQELLGGVGNVASVNGHTGIVALDKTDVGLSNADNTSDANKPVSTAAAAALATKQPLDSDLTTISAITASNNDIIQRIAGAWTNRTPAQVKTSLLLGAGDVGLDQVPNVDATQRANHTGTQLAATISDLAAAVQTNRLDQMAAPNAAVDMNGQLLTGLADPVSLQDAVTKAYADALASGLFVKAPVRVASTGTINLSSPGAAIDGVTLTSGDRVLAKDQSTPSQNGIWIFNGAASAMTRAADADSSAEMKAGTYTFASEGTANADTSWVLTTNNPVTLGSTPLVFTNFSSVSLPDATTAIKGKLKLGGDLGGTADAPMAKSRTITRTVGIPSSVADYVCDGADDDVQIMAAAAEVDGLGGGTVYILKGTYSIGTAMRYYPRVHFKGEGMFLTRLVATNTIPGGKGIFNDRNYTSDDPLTYTEVSDMELDGSLMDKPLYNAGYSIGRKGLDGKYIRYGYWHDLYIHDFPATGFGVDNISHGLVDHLIIKNCGTPGAKAAVTLTSDNTNVSDGETVTLGKKSATNTLTCGLTDVTNGDTVTVDTTTYTFVGSLSGSAYEVLIGGTPGISMRNLQYAILAKVDTGIGPGIQYGTGTVEHPTVTVTSTSTSSTSTKMTLVAKTTGTGGNSIATTETSTQLSFSSSTLLLGTDRTYTFRTSPSVADDIQVGASADASLTNFALAINGTGTAGVNYASGTTVHTLVAASTVSGHAIIISSILIGDPPTYSGNAIASIETSAHLSFSATKLSGGVKQPDQGSNGVGIGVGGMPDESCIVTNCITENTAHEAYLLENLESITGTQKLYVFANNISLNDHIGFSTSGQYNVVIANNAFYGSAANAIQGINFSHKQFGELAVTGNVIINAGSNGISLNEHDDTAVAVQTVISSFTIANNIIAGTTTHGIFIRDSNGSVTGNTVHDTGQNGIYAIGSSSVLLPLENITVANNTVYNSGKSITNGDGIKFDAASGDINNLTLIGNRCFDNQTVKTQRYGIALANGIMTNVTVVDNNLTGNNTDGLFHNSTITGFTRRNNMGTSSNYDLTANAQSFTGITPFNKTTGDITGTRLMLGANTAFTGLTADMVAEATTTGAGDKSNLYSYLTANPASSSSTEFRGVRGTVEHKNGNTNTLTTLVGVYGSSVVRGNANISNLAGARFHGAVVPSDSTLNGSTLTNVWGIDVTGFKISGTPPNAATITTVKGIIVNDNDAPSPLSITNTIGLDINSMTRGGTLNLGLRIAAPSGASTNYAVELSDTGGTSAGGILFGTSGTANLYRSAANTVKTDGSLVIGGSLTVTDQNIILGTTTGTKVGTATTQKLGFFNATPIVQPTGDVVTALSNLGLIATPTISATSAQSLVDSNGNNVMLSTATASAVSYLNVTNAASGGTITLAFTASSGTPNSVIKGSGTFAIRPTSNSANAIRLQDASGSNNMLVADSTNIRVGIAKTSPTVTLDVGGIVGLLAGTSATIAKAGGTIFNHFADAGNTSTTETDLYSDSIPASALGTNGDKLEATYGCIFVNSTSTKQLKLYFGGTAIFDTGALTISASSEISLEALIIRVSSTVVRYVIRASTTGASTGSYSAVGELTGLTLSNANTLKITGTAAGVGAATNDIVAKASTVDWKSAA